MWSYISAPPYVLVALFLCAEMLLLPLYQTDWRIGNLPDLFSRQSQSIQTDLRLFSLTYRDITDCPVKCQENQPNNHQQNQTTRPATNQTTTTTTKNRNKPTHRTTNISTNQPTAWRKLLLKKLTVAQLLNTFAAFYRIKSVISVFTSPPPIPTLSQMNLVNMLPFSLSLRRSLMLSSYRRLPSLPFRLCNKNIVSISHLACALHALHISASIWLFG